MNVFLKLRVLWLILTATIPLDHMTVCAARDTKPSMIQTSGCINAKVKGNQQTTLFFIRTSNFGAEAERSYYVWQFEPEKFFRCS